MATYRGWEEGQSGDPPSRERGSPGERGWYEETGEYGGRRMQGRYGGTGEQRWSGTREEMGRPWVERWPDTHEHERVDTKGLIEWEDHGPLEWLGDKLREMKSRRRLRGPKGFKRSDERILDDLCERIARTGIDADGLEVKVENGEVTISGIVASRVDKWRLEVIADDVFGVEEVHDQVRVARTPPGERVAGPAEDLRH